MLRCLIASKRLADFCCFLLVMWRIDLTHLYAYLVVFRILYLKNFEI